MTVLLALEFVGPRLRARRLVFSDPAIEPRTTSASVVRALDLAAGCDVDVPKLADSIAELEPDRARERALRLLGYRDRSAAEVHRALAEDGYPSPIVDAVVARLVELDFLNDERFARSWIATRRASGFGDQRIRRELAQKGIPQAVAAAVFEPDCESDDLVRARQALRGQTATTPRDRERLVRRLVTRGFSLSTALAAVGRVSIEVGDVNPPELGQ